MDDSDEFRLAPRHVAELSDFFAAHDRWLFGHACVRTRGDRELAADLVQDTSEAAARAWDMLRGHPAGRQRAWLLGTLANKDVSEFRRQEAFRRRQPDIQARYQGIAADFCPSSASTSRSGTPPGTTPPPRGPGSQPGSANGAASGQAPGPAHNSPARRRART
jgi:DNA-directed RNA polymerase specialized sigma24 family protein